MALRFLFLVAAAAFLTCASATTKKTSGDNTRKQHGMKAALEGTLISTGALLESMANLFASESLSKAQTEVIPHMDKLNELKGKVDENHEDKIEDFIQYQVIPEVEEIIADLSSEAILALLHYDSVEYDIPVEVISPEFTVRDVLGVIAGFCTPPEVKIQLEKFTVEKDTMHEYLIELQTSEVALQPFRSLLTFGEVFIPTLRNGAPPFSFSGSFSFTQVAKGFADSINIVLEKQVPMSGWGSIERECLTSIAPGTPKFEQPLDCTSSNLSIIDPLLPPETQDLCKTPPALYPTVCRDFTIAYCSAVTREILSPMYHQMVPSIFKIVNDELLPQCFSVL